jgi:adenosylcobyric acid synthase
VFANRGLRLRPFKPQNMSNNAAVTADGGEIGRAQALQAMACRTPLTVDMNPVLLTPQSDVGAQLVVLGKMMGTWKARGYQERKGELLDTVLTSFRKLEAESDLVIVEGAGSPAEINLRAGDIANMGFARAADVPVVLVGDIDRGHVIAALVGAHAVLEEGDRAMVRGFVINKFRGDPSLFQDGRTEITRRTGWADLGMAPWLAAARSLPAEDAVVLDRPREGERRHIRIVAPMLSRIANFDDFDALRVEPEVDFAFIPPGQPLPGDADLVILPGTKATLADLAFLRAQGWDVDLAGHVRRGGRVLGVCGGYQMLGRTLSDPDGIEGPPETVDGLGLLEVDTVLTGEKMLRPVTGRLASSSGQFEGYEMHVGQTTGSQAPLLILDDGSVDGAISANSQIMGCYVHGLFNQGSARRAFLGGMGVDSDGLDQSLRVDHALDEIAVALERAFDIQALAALAGLELRS